VSFDMRHGQILGLIGPNGAGKTTLFNCLSRSIKPSSGDILMEGKSILSRPPHRIAEIGIGRPSRCRCPRRMATPHALASSDVVSDLARSWPMGADAMS